MLPSFSSKGVPKIKQVIQGTSERIGVPCLISAYDLYYERIDGPFDFAEALFVDSGGFEASKEIEFSEYGLVPHEPLEWDQAKYGHVVRGWNSATKTVLVSYDHPRERYSTSDQIQRADEMLPTGPRLFRELLLKPEPASIDTDSSAQATKTVNVNAIVSHISEMNKFDAIGVTEKEIGLTLRDRLLNIARIRRAMMQTGMESKPIHIFGSLDTICTPLYYVAGADIFDGLTWLKFSYEAGMTMYRQSYVARTLGMDFVLDRDLVDLQCHWANIAYLKDFEIEMRGYPTKGLTSFKHNHQLISDAVEIVQNSAGA